MSEGVIHLLEAVQVEHQQSEWRVPAFEHGAESLLQKAPVGKSCQAVVRSVIVQILLALPLRSHVPDRDRNDEGVLPCKPVHRNLGCQFRAICADQIDGLCELWALVAQSFQTRLKLRGDLSHRPTAHYRGTIAEDSRGSGVDLAHKAVLVESQDAVH